MNKKINILFFLYGSTGYALEQNFKKSKYTGEMYILSDKKPFNSNCTYLGSQKNLKIGELKKLINYYKIDLIICFAENYTQTGFINFCKEHLNIPTIGCTREWFILESSKISGKHFMQDENIKMPQFTVIYHAQNIDYAISEFNLPLVLKNNNLKAGFGSYICHTKKEAEKRAKEILKENQSCIVEKFIQGSEISQQYIWDEKTLLPLKPVRDYKKSINSIKGINTGGLGCYTPVKLTEEQNIMLKAYNEKIALIFEKLKPNFTGIFTANLMFTQNDLYTLEFNMRPGITEFETTVENLDCDLLELLYRTATNNLKDFEIKYKEQITGCVNIAHKDYLKQKENQKKIDISKFIKKQTEKIKINYNLYEPEKNNKVFIETNKRFLSILSSDDTNPFPTIYNYLQSVNNQNVYYRKDIGD